PRLADLPTDPGDALGNPTVDLAFQQLDDLWPPLVPPLFGGRDLLPVLRLEDLRQLRVGIGPRLVVVRRIRRVGIAAPAGTKLLDAQLVEHVLTILRRREHDRLLISSCSGRDRAVLRPTKV